MTKATILGGGCWPTEAQQLLLRAALLEGEDALVSWREWQRRTDIEDLDAGSSRLLPLLEWNLHRHDVRDPQMARYKSVSRHYWFSNQLLFQEAARLLRLFEESGIPTLVLKGGDLAHRFYPRISARPMSDFDILVPTGHALRAFEIMAREGYDLPWWRDSATPAPPAFFSILHAYSFRKPNGRAWWIFDVHREILGAQFRASDDDEFWRAGVPLVIGGAATRALCAEDAFLHASAHGVCWNPVPPVRWIADCALILRATPEFNWERLVFHSRRQHLAVPVRRALRFLRRLELGMAIPPAVVREIEAIPTSRLERREHNLLALPRHAQSVSLKAWLRLGAYARWNATNPLWQRPFTLASYCQLYWGFSSPVHALRHGWQRWHR